MRDVAPAAPNANDAVLGGVMHYVAIDVRNLSLWLQGSAANGAPYAAGSGPQALNNNGYGVYFSDRRNNRADGTNVTVRTPRPASTASRISSIPRWPAAFRAWPWRPAKTSTATASSTDTAGFPASSAHDDQPVPNGARRSAQRSGTAHDTQSAARMRETNRAILFRRALKLDERRRGQHRAAGALDHHRESGLHSGRLEREPGGLDEQPVGDVDHRRRDHAAVESVDRRQRLGESVQPVAPGPRTQPSWYRVAIIAGKGPAFTNIAGTPNDFGTDGGAHNFLRYLESGQTVNYEGAIATFFYNRQAVGTYKCCTTVYGAPGRNYLFDTNFLNPALLPPLTPVFRDVNITGFSQETRPGK